MINQELSTPLIGTLPQEADVECQSIASPVEAEDIRAEESSCDRFLTYLLPLLLLAQFGSAYRFHEGNALGLEWKEVFCSIMIFGITSIFYLRTLREEKLNCIFLNIFPDITTVLVCGLVYFQMISAAFVALVVSMMAMALFIIISSVHLLCTESDETNEEEEYNIILDV